MTTMPGNKRYLLVGAAIVLALLGAVMGTRLWRGNPPAALEEPSKTRGPANAAVSVMEFSDFACPYCARISPVLKHLQKKFPSDVRFSFKHFPLKMHQPAAGWAAEASECAADQGKFWEYHDLLYENQKNWYPKQKNNHKGTRPRLIELAKTLELDQARFQACVESGEKEAIVNQNKSEGDKFMVRGTPTLILNQRKFVASMNEKGIRKAITDEVKKSK